MGSKAAGPDLPRRSAGTSPVIGTGIAEASETLSPCSAPAESTTLGEQWTTHRGWPPGVELRFFTSLQAVAGCLSLGKSQQLRSLSQFELAFAGKISSCTLA